MFKDTLGPYGLNNRNKKGKDLLFLIKSNQLKILLTFYKHKNYTTYRTFSKAKSPHTLDNFICCAKFYKRVKDCKLTNRGARSDHSAISVKFKLTSIKLNINKTEIIVIDCEKIRNDKIINKKFNDKLHHSLMENDLCDWNPTDGSHYTSYNELILQTAKQIATKPKFENKGWFHHSKTLLLPAINLRDKLLHILRNATPTAASFTRKALYIAQTKVTDTLALAKASWSAHLAKQVHDMRFNPKNAWKAVKLLVGGKESHHVNPIMMHMKLPNRTIANTDEENASVLGPHFAKVYTNHQKNDWTALHDISQRDEMIEINRSIEWDELVFAVNKLANNKSPGLNDIPPEAYNTLSTQNLNILLIFFKAYWQGKIDFTEWHEGQVVPVPKSGDLSDPNKWRGVTLMVMESKIFSSILCKRLFRIIDKHGVKYQFYSTPKVGCQDRGFIIKILLPLRRNHNLPTWILFANLVKAFDTSNHKLIIKVLAKYGCPPKVQNTIARLYKDNVVRLIIGKIDTSIPFEIGVKQGNSMAPILFLFLMMAFAETLEKEWVQHGLHQLEYRQHDNSIHSNGRISSHPRSTFSEGTLFELFCILYVDDGAFAFSSHKEIETGTTIIQQQSDRFGLQIHVSSNTKA